MEFVKMTLKGWFSLAFLGVHVARLEYTEGDEDLDDEDDEKEKEDEAKQCWDGVNILEIEKVVDRLWMKLQ